MNAVGIDVSSRKSTVAVLRPLGNVVLKPFDVKHTSTGLAELAKQLKAIEGETRVIMEHTGRYYEAVANALYQAGLYVSCVNPLLIKEYGGNSLRKVKTDKADARKIAKYGLDNWAELREYSPMDELRYNLKTTNRQFQLASKTRTAISNNLVALLEQTYPGIRSKFDSPPREDGHQKWVDFVGTFWHVDCVRSMSEKAFTKRYQQWCKQNKYHFRQSKAEEIYQFSQELMVFLPITAPQKMLIEQAVNQLNAVSKSVEILRREMVRLASQLPEYPIVMSMYGCGDSTGPQLMAEIGDIRRFSGKKSLVAFAGTDPKPAQSGAMNVKHTKTSKRGSPYLRKTLFTIMDIMIQKSPFDEPVFQFMNKKRSEGKPYYVYTTAGATKFLRMYFGKVRDYLNTLEGGQSSSDSSDASTTDSTEEIHNPDTSEATSLAQKNANAEQCKDSALADNCDSTSSPPPMDTGCAQDS